MGEDRLDGLRRDEELVQELIQSYHTGSTVYELADHFSIGRNTVCRLLHHHGVTMRRRGLSPNQITEAPTLHHQGWAPPRIAHHLGVDPSTVRRRLHDHATATCATPGQPRAGDAR